MKRIIAKPKPPPGRPGGPNGRRIAPRRLPTLDTPKALHAKLPPPASKPPEPEPEPEPETTQPRPRRVTVPKESLIVSLGKLEVAKPRMKKGRLDDCFWCAA